MSLLFQEYQVAFTTDTGLDWKTNIDTFIQYCQAQALYVILKQQQDLLTKLIKEVNELDT
jgi:hypothetical protein